MPLRSKRPLRPVGWSVGRYVALLVLIACCAAPAWSQDVGGPLGPRLQDARIVGRGNTITIRRMPVDTPSGVVYRDITIQLQVDASGGLHVDAAGTPPKGRQATATLQARRTEPVVTHDVSVGSITETTTPPEIAAPFTAGMYQSASGALVRVSNVGRKLFEGFPTWSLTAFSGDSIISSAEWYSGPLRTNPHHQLLNTAGITSDDYSYGTIQSSGGGHFDNGMLIGAVQKGDTLTIVSFHRRGCCTYQSTPTGEVTYTRVGG